MGLGGNFKTPTHDKDKKPIPVREHRSDQSAMSLSKAFVDATLISLSILGGSWKERSKNVLRRPD
jgi:hypothetical protein